jgi:hypothetical protein
MIRSSAIREMWTMVIVTQKRNSATKSRSATACIELRLSDLNASSSARSFRSTANGFPARGPDPRGRVERRGINDARREWSETRADVCERRK